VRFVSGFITGLLAVVGCLGGMSYRVDVVVVDGGLCTGAVMDLEISRSGEILTVAAGNQVSSSVVSFDHLAVVLYGISVPNSML